MSWTLDRTDIFLKDMHNSGEENCAYPGDKYSARKVLSGKLKKFKKFSKNPLTRSRVGVIICKLSLETRETRGQHKARKTGQKSYEP